MEKLIGKEKLENWKMRLRSFNDSETDLLCEQALAALAVPELARQVKMMRESLNNCCQAEDGEYSEMDWDEAMDSVHEAVNLPITDAERLVKEV